MKAPAEPMLFPPFMEGLISYLASRSLDWLGWRIWVASESQNFLKGDFGFEITKSNKKTVSLTGTFGKEIPSAFLLVNEILKPKFKNAPATPKPKSLAFKMEKNSKGVSSFKDKSLNEDTP